MRKLYSHLFTGLFLLAVITGCFKKPDSSSETVNTNDTINDSVEVALSKNDSLVTPEVPTGISCSGIDFLGRWDAEKIVFEGGEENSDVAQGRGFTFDADCSCLEYGPDHVDSLIFEWNESTKVLEIKGEGEKEISKRRFRLVKHTESQLVLEQDKSFMVHYRKHVGS